MSAKVGGIRGHGAALNRTMEVVTETRELIYVGDPMCSWCWGVAPELDELMERRPDLPLQIVVGGLRPGPNARVVDESMVRHLSTHWAHVEEASGQPFDRSLLARPGWIYDTEPACRAVVVMRELDESQAWPLFKRLQHLFYAEGVVLSDTSIYPEVIDSFDVESDVFLERFGAPESVKATWRDFATAHNWGITGFPTVIARTGDRGHVVTQGYATADRMVDAVDRLLPAAGELCGPDGNC